MNSRNLPNDYAARRRPDPDAANHNPIDRQLTDDAPQPDWALSIPAPTDVPAPPRWLSARDVRSHRPRRVLLPVVLFLATGFSTFFAGAMRWEPIRAVRPTPGFVVDYGESYVRRSMVANYRNGLVYMVCVMSILLAHEMGHFLATLWYRIPASLPYFLPFPIAPIGTMGAVIGMEGQRANRREIFDIGLAGPIAGLLVAAPILWIGIAQLDFNSTPHGSFQYDCPLMVRWIINHVHPDQAGVRLLRTSQINPLFMAGWVGLLITGLNMLPVSQLDGGHVTYTLFGKGAHWIARLFVITAIVYIWYARAMMWSLMVVLVLFIGTDHPPTADDRVPLGWVRTVIGLASLTIPVLCFPPRGLMMVF